MVLSWCNRSDFDIHPYTDIIRGNGTPAVWLTELPVQSITALYLDNQAFGGSAPNAFGPNSQLTEGVDWYLDRDGGPGTPSASGIIYRTTTTWDQSTTTISGLVGAVNTLGQGNIRVDYTAGYPTCPEDVQLATEMLVAKIRRSRLAGDTLKDHSYEESAEAYAAQNRLGFLTPEITTLLSPYKKIW